MLGGMTVAELDARMGASELALWKARAQLETYLRNQTERRKVNRAQAMEFARAEHRAVIERKAQAGR